MPFVPQGNRSALRKKGRRRALPRHMESAAPCRCSQMTDQPSTGSGKKVVWGTVDKVGWLAGGGRLTQGPQGRRAPPKLQKHEIPGRPIHPQGTRLLLLILTKL